jgi:hypothetical protein
MFSVDWVKNCIEAEQLLEHDTPAYRLGVATRSTKTLFSREDDKLLEEFVKSKKAQNAFLNGNKIYEEFAERVRPLSCTWKRNRESDSSAELTSFSYHSNHSNDIC